jgi:hypothetical protein
MSSFRNYHLYIVTSFLLCLTLWDG